MDRLHILFIMGILMLVDAAVCLGWLSRWQHRLPGWPLKKVALAEALIALVLLTIYFTRRFA
jgi:hypothetical protein